MGDEEPRPRRKKKKKRAPGPYREPAPKPPPPPVLEGWAPPWLAHLTTGIAAFFLLLVYADASGWQWLGDHLPRPLRYFAQVAALFPEADKFATEYHAEGWVCRDKRWVELDLRRWFPIDADEKENRFSRTMQFYPRDRPAMNALDEYVVSHENRARLVGDSASTDLLGGIRVSRISIPLPEFGEHVDRYTRRTIASVPRGWKHDYYWTKLSKRFERCKGLYPEYDDRDVDDKAADRQRQDDEARGHDKAQPEGSEP